MVNKSANQIIRQELKKHLKKFGYKGTQYHEFIEIMLFGDSTRFMNRKLLAYVFKINNEIGFESISKNSLKPYADRIIDDELKKASEEQDYIENDLIVEYKIYYTLIRYIYYYLITEQLYKIEMEYKSEKYLTY